jgi:hypothetical protein
LAAASELDATAVHGKLITKFYLVAMFFLTNHVLLIHLILASIRLSPGVSLEKRRVGGQRSMRRFFRKLCCCFRPQPCKSKHENLVFLINILGADLERALTENGQKHRNGAPVQATTPPTSIITQVTKDSADAYTRPNNHNYVQSLKSASLRASLRGANNAPVNSLNGALVHTYNNGSLSAHDKKRPRIQQEVCVNKYLNF